MADKMTPIDTLLEVCTKLTEGNAEAAAETLSQGYPFTPLTYERRAYTESISTSVFMRDGFIDRYSGERLVLPGALRLIAIKLPVAFPYHRNWKMSETHPAFWQLSATIDHVIPIARGGKDEAANMISTSMLRNSAKCNWLVKELGWTIATPGTLKNWDGLTSWFVSEVESNASLLAMPFVRRWFAAASDATAASPFHGDVA